MNVLSDFNLNSIFVEHILDLFRAAENRLLPGLFDLLIGILVIRIIVRISKIAFKIANIQPGLRGVLSGVIETVLWFFLIVALLQTLGFSGVIVFFTGSIAAFGIAMAAGGSTLIADIVAGIFLARDPDFSVGDQVIVGETPTVGTIESMDARRTRIRDEYGVLHVIPNTLVERKEWVVLKKRPETGALTKAARRIRRVAEEKLPVIEQKAPRIRKNKR